MVTAAQALPNKRAEFIRLTYTSSTLLPIFLIPI
jgi:hypothetical protein